MSSLFHRVARLLEERLRALTFLSAMLPTIAALAIQFMTFAITARGLGVEQFGRYVSILAIVGVSVELVGLGGADLLVRAVARDREKFRIYYGNMLLLAAATLPVVVALAAAVAAMAMRTNVDLVPMVAALLAEIAVARMSASLELVMVAHGHVVRAGWVRVSTAAVRLVLALCFFMVLALNELHAWIWGVFAQSAVLTVAYAVIGGRLYGRPLWQVTREELGAGASFCVTQAARSAQSNLDRMILTRYADDATLGVYGAACRIVQLGMFPIQVLTRIFYPKFFVHGADGIAASRRYALRTAPALAAVGVFSAICVAIAASIVPALLGSEYSGSIDAALGLACALPVIALQYPAADALTAGGRQALRATIYSMTAVGFGFVLLAGAHIGGLQGVIVGFFVGHLALMLVLWGSVFTCSDEA